MADHYPNPDTVDAVVLLSGGLDSATCLAAARFEGRRCRTLAVDYGQRHRSELEAAAALASHLGSAEHRIVRVDLRAIGGSALTGEIEVPKDSVEASGIPVTYVPARNMLLLSVAAGYAEVAGADEIFIGVNAVDYSGYPDCRRGFIEAMERAIGLGTRAGVEGRGPRIRTPLIALRKAEIIRLGATLGVDFSLTRSCYDPDEDGNACGACDSCIIRRRGFEAAGIADPTRYAGVMP